MTPKKKPNPFEERLARQRADASLPAQQSGAPTVPGGFSSTPSGQNTVAFAQARADKMMTFDDLPDPVKTDAEGPLTEEEEQILELCMRGVKQFENAWWVMAKAMANINARRLYRGTHPTFEAFARDVFNKSRPTAYEEMTAYAIGELLSARADKLFEEDSNEVSARADITIGKKAAIALNPLTQDYGADTAVKVYETVTDAAGRTLPVKELKGIVRQLPRKTPEQNLTAEDLTALAREVATQQTQRSGSSTDQERQSGSPLAHIRTAVRLLTEAHKALAPAKIRQALAEAPEEAAGLLAVAAATADKTAARARKEPS